MPLISLLIPRETREKTFAVDGPIRCRRILRNLIILRLIRRWGLQMTVGVFLRSPRPSVFDSLTLKLNRGPARRALTFVGLRGSFPTLTAKPLMRLKKMVMMHPFNVFMRCCLVSLRCRWGYRLRSGPVSPPSGLPPSVIVRTLFQGSPTECEKMAVQDEGTAHVFASCTTADAE